MNARVGPPSKRLVRPLASTLAALLALGAGCASPLRHLKERVELPTERGQFILQYAPQDADALPGIETSLRRAASQLERWGSLREPVHIRILPSHDDLEAAVNRRGYAWLRAWAKYDEVFLQSPRTWGVFGAAQDQLDELMLHELTHCLMYQQAATRTGWTRKRIPLWFREGMASFTANQGYRWPALEDLAQLLEQDPSTDPVSRPDGMYQHRSDWVYAAAHHAFAFLVRRYGEQRIRDLLGAMREGREFPEAFAEVIGIGPERFASDFRRYVKLRGFRGGRLQRPVTQ